MLSARLSQLECIEGALRVANPSKSARKPAAHAGHFSAWKGTCPVLGWHQSVRTTSLLTLNLSLICSGLGRPASLSLEEIGLAQPERPSFMSAQVTVSELIRSVQHLYNHHDSSVSADLKNAHRIRNKLRSFAQTVKEDLEFTIGTHLGTERDENFVTRAVLSYCKSQF